MHFYSYVPVLINIVPIPLISVFTSLWHFVMSKALKCSEKSLYGSPLTHYYTKGISLLMTNSLLFFCWNAQSNVNLMRTTIVNFYNIFIKIDASYREVNFEVHTFLS